MYVITQEDIAEKLRFLQPLVDPRPRPPLYSIVFWDDDQTEIDFLVATMIKHFSLPGNVIICLLAKRKSFGSCSMGTFTREIAEEKASIITWEAALEGQELKVEIERI